MIVTNLIHGRRLRTLGLSIAVGAGLLAGSGQALADTKSGLTNGCSSPTTHGQALDRQTHAITYNKNFIYSGVQWKIGSWSGIAHYSPYSISSPNSVSSWGDGCQ